MPNPASSGLSDNLAHYTPTAEGIRDDITQLEWQDTVNANSKIKQGEAIQYCKDLGSGWRLPTRLELASLVDWTRTGPTIDPMFAGTPAQWFWTSSIFACNPNSAYYVGFDKGSTHPISPDTQNFYRCVRGGPARCVQTRYVLVDAGKSVHDAVTGLTWQRDTAPKKNWSDAKSTCLNLGGGWRLPSPGELQTLVDETKGGQDMDGKDVAPLDRDMFPNTPAAYFWASAPLAGDSSRAWYVAFIHGHADVDMVANLNYFRCVRWDGTQTP
jgi:hypothetical protein